MNLRTIAANFTDPSTRTGTAWWACLVMALYDAAKHHLNLVNGGVLLALAGLGVAAGFLGQAQGQATPPAAPPAEGA